MLQDRFQRRRALPASVLALLLLALPACDDDDDFVGPVPGGVEAPEMLTASYGWVLEGWQGTEPVGYPAVTVSWELPYQWEGEPFRVYARRSGGSWVLAGTVTSCLQGVCVYTDLNVAPRESYDYYVAAVNERRGREVASATSVSVDVPSAAAPGTPEAPRVVALDNALYLQWPGVGASRYLVYLEADDGTLYDVGETDGDGYLDERAENGVRAAYRVAAVDDDGHPSDLSPAGEGVARPDYHAELLYSYGDDPALSGFRFAGTEAEVPVLGGDEPAAQWRLEEVEGVLSFRPLGNTRVTSGTYTTALACGPGSEPDCVAVETAPAATAFGAAPVPVSAGDTYVFRVEGGAGQSHYGKVRVQGQTLDEDGLPVVILDWAYQTVAGEPSLVRIAG